MRKVVALLLVAFVPLLVAGCASSEGQRVNPDIEAVQSQDFNPEDLRIIVEKGVRELVQKVQMQLGPAAFIGGPVVFVGPAQNRTDEHIDMSLVQNYLESELTNQLTIRLVDRGKAMEISRKELEFQQTGQVSPATIRRIGEYAGAKFLVYGELGNLRTFQRSRRAEGQYFQFALSLIDVETLDKIPVTVRIQKVAKPGTFGW